MAPTGAMFVRALYDYDADDHTSLSFRQGDIIQVITQLESGWWDGVIGGVHRGWFPSNYCEVVSRTGDDARDERNGHAGEDADGEESPDDYSDREYDGADMEGNGTDDTSRAPMERMESREHDETAFWIPQATPDGRLFYFNTLTGVSTMELPLETPTGPNESGPRDRTNVYIPEQTRRPPELMAGGFERDENTDFENSASEADAQSAMMASGSLPPRNRSFASNGVSPATSMDSMKLASPNSRSRMDLHEASTSSFSAVQNSLPPSKTGMTSFTTNASGAPLTAAMTRRFFDDQHAVPLTWNRLVEDMRRSVERYRQAINNSDRSEFVKRAEDISDHLRLLLAAGSGTTDNHSGNPSIISTNKALYPHFRETMSRFSKLVLSSHIASSDWPPADSYVKCLTEAAGVLNGVYGFVEVARQQRGEEIPRLIPGFVVGSHAGGSWQNNGLGSRDPLASMSFIEQDEHEPVQEPTSRLNSKLLERMEDLRRMISTSIRRLDELLNLREKLITPQRHQAISESVCRAGGRVLEIYKPWLSTVESIDLGPLGSDFQNPQLSEFGVQKQKVYDLIAELLISCQAVAAPLADEWAESRGDSLDDRFGTVRSVSKELDTCTSQLYFSLQLLSEMMPLTGASPAYEDYRRTDGDAYHRINKNMQRPKIGDVEQPHSYTDGVEPIPENYRNQDNSKLMKFFGEVPSQVQHEETPEFLRLDHEGEIQYDTKTSPAQVRGGTLAGLVEQLTRHDKLEAAFNTTFLLTYRSFTTASELFEMLVKRWSIQPPFGLAKEDYHTWVEKKQKVIRVRVVNILKSWFDHYWLEGNDDEARQLIGRVYSFAKDHVATTTAPSAQTLMKSVEERSRGHDAPTKRLVMTPNTNTPQPILPKHMKKLKFLDIDTTEFARQLTIIESRLYGKIRPTECLNKTWQKRIAPGEPDPAPNVKALILHSNQLTNWVAQMILTQQDVKRRVVVIKHFVLVADKCRSLNNFSTLTSIISALGTAPIHRLSRTWNSVNARTMTTLESMRKLMGSTKNFAEYRDTLHKALPPCIPFFGVYLTDLTFIEDGIPSLIKKTNLINFTKRLKTAEVIRDIQQYQNVSYSLQPVPELQDYILTNMQSAGDVHEMYEMSLTVEPREREDEKIARLLSESGFL